MACYIGEDLDGCGIAENNAPEYKRTAETMDSRGTDSMSGSSVFTEDKILTFYHAGEGEVRAPRWDYAQAILNKNEADLRDFGLGFYTCLDAEYPLKLASAKGTLALNKYVANLKDLRCIEFGLDLEWLLSVGFHRRDLNSRKWCHALRDRCRVWLSDCDVAIGVISNDKTYQAVEGFLDNTATDVAAIAMVNAANYGKQYVFKSQRACDRLREGFRNCVFYTPVQVEEYRDKFLSEKKEFDQKADSLRMDMMERGGGVFFERIVLGGLFNGKVRF